MIIRNGTIGFSGEHDQNISKKEKAAVTKNVMSGPPKQVQER